MMNKQEILKSAPEGATHFRQEDEEWGNYYIKVMGEEKQQVLVWVAIRPEWGHWSDIACYDKNPENYIKLTDIK